MNASSINHVSVHAIDLDESMQFYEQVFGMERIATPNFPFPEQWMRLGSQQLHLFVREDASAPTFHHVGLNVDDFERVFWLAREQGFHDESAYFSAVYELPDGSVQMFLRDPAGNLLEINWSDASTLDARIRAEIIALSSTTPQSANALRATLYLDRPK